jgi:hypothetical protein
MDNEGNNMCMKIKQFPRHPAYVAGILIIFLALVTCQGISQVIPANRTTVWTPGVTVGVPGGIPNRTTIYVNVLTDGGAMHCYGDGIHDDSAAINQAIAWCPANEVIYLPAGTYLLNHSVGTDSWGKNCTLRGDGMGKTIFVVAFAPGSGWPGFTFHAGQYQPPSYQTANILSGLSKGSTNIVLDSAPYLLALNSVLLIDQLNDTTNVNANGSEGLVTWADRNDNGTRNLGQAVMVTATNFSSGFGITFWPPLNMNFSTNLSAQATASQNWSFA